MNRNGAVLLTILSVSAAIVSTASVYFGLMGEVDIKSRLMVSETNGKCIKEAMKGFFSRGAVLRIVLADPNVDAADFIRSFGSEFAIYVRDDVKNVEGFISQHPLIDPEYYRYLVFATNASQLHDVFQHNRASVTSQYLIITNFSGQDLVDFSRYTIAKSYLYTGFVELVDRNRCIIRRLHKSGQVGNGSMTLEVIAECSKNDYLVRRLGQPFEDLLCLNQVCQLRYIRVYDGLSKAEIRKADLDMSGIPQLARYRYDEAYREKDILFQDFGTRMLFDFSRIYDLRVTNFVIYEDITWEEAVGQLHSGEVDVIYGGRSNLPLELMEGLSVVNYVRYQHLCFIGQTKKSILPLNSVLVPLSSDIWYCILCSFGLYNVFVFLTIQLYKMGLLQEKLTVLDSIRILIGQSSSLPRRTSLRYVSGIWLLCSTVLVAIYTCDFQTHLILKSAEEKTESLETLADEKRTFDGAIYWLTHLRRFNDSTIKKIINLYNPLYYFTIDDNLISETYDNVMLVDDIGVRLVMANDKLIQKDLRIYGEPVISQPLFFYVKQGHPYEKLLQKFITLEKSVGLVVREVHFPGFETGLKCYCFRNVTVEQFLPAVLIILIGLCFGYLTLVIEIFGRRMYRTNNSQWRQKLNK